MNKEIEHLYCLNRFGSRQGLENVSELLRIVGNPEKSFKTIHITGTKGKGSTASFIASILQESGYKTGLFTSPHLQEFTERIKINNKEISEKELVSLIREIKPAVNSMRRNRKFITFHEFTTAIAYEYFKRKNVDFAVIEVGMGGRLDSTNTILPEVCAITNISLEHTKILGKTVKKIAWEKAGIIKKNVPVFTEETKKECVDVFGKVCKDKKSPLNIVNRDFGFVVLDSGSMGITCDVWYKKNRLRRLKINSAGLFQAKNAALAVALSLELSKKNKKISEKSIRKGIFDANLSGRFEIISRNPLIIIDCCHTPESAQEFLGSVSNAYPEREKICVMGFARGKRINEMCREVQRCSKNAIITRARFRGEAVSKIKAAFKGGSKGIANVGKAVSYAKRLAEKKKNSVILVFGSTYVSGEAKDYVTKKKNKLMPQS